MAITVGCLLCTAFLFTNCINRIAEAFRDFGLSVAYYFCELFYIEHNITATVTELPSLSLFPITGAATVDIPETWESFKVSFKAYWELWASTDNLKAYFSSFGDIVYWLCYGIILVLPFVMILVIGLRQMMNKENNDYAEESFPLRLWLKAREKVYVPVREWIKSFCGFVRKRKYYWVTWLLVWLLNFNIFTILIEFLAFYLYFCISFDFSTIYRQVYKLITDLATPVSFIPWYIWVVIGIIFFDFFVKKLHMHGSIILSAATAALSTSAP